MYCSSDIKLADAWNSFRPSVAAIIGVEMCEGRLENEARVDVSLSRVPPGLPRLYGHDEPGLRHSAGHLELVSPPLRPPDQVGDILTLLQDVRNSDMPDFDSKSILYIKKEDLKT